MVLAAFAALDATEPGQITDLPHRWSSSDDWKDRVMRPKPKATTSISSGDEAATTDDRVQRYETPQYQCATDATAAAISHAEAECLVCAGIDY